MGQYKIKGSETVPVYLQVLKEDAQGYHVCIIRKSSDYEKKSEQFIPHELFQTCLRTGYFTALKGA